MASENPTVWSIDPHTHAKHQILEEYLKRWFPILSSTSNRVVYLDGFAGPGTYTNGEDGSPIIAIKTALEHKLAERFQKIVFWFIEKDPRRTENLEQTLQNFSGLLPNNLQYHVEKSEFAPSLEKTLDDIEEEGADLAPTFAFIDPFGFSGMPMRLIARILGYQKCEVLITFMSSFIIRFNDELRENALDDLFDSKDWRKIHKITDPDEKRRFVVDFYVKQLRKCGGVKFDRTFEMVGSNNQIVYHLIFATKNIAGLKAMKEAMLKVDRRGTFRFSDRTDPNQTFLLDYSDNKKWSEQASGLVHAEFAGKTVSVDEVENFVWSKTPFVFKKLILKEMEKKGKITRVDGRTRALTFPSGCSITFSK